MTLRLWAACAIMVLGTAAAPAEPCPGNPDALGTSRELVVDPATMPRIGRKHFPQTLPLQPREVVLTFDDGPEASTTARVLDALKRECVKATFFLIGRNAVANPTLARRELQEGHTVAYHTYAHPLLNRMPLANATAEIDRGFEAIDTILHGTSGKSPVTPFFRFPGFASNAPLLEMLERRRIAVFGADVWASDWNRMTPAHQLALVLGRIEAAHGGIVLFHDTRTQTAAMVAPLLRALKIRGYSVVHTVPPRTPASSR